jgi:hypothetical protein
MTFGQSKQLISMTMSTSSLVASGVVANFGKPLFEPRHDRVRISSLAEFDNLLWCSNLWSIDPPKTRNRFEGHAVGNGFSHHMLVTSVSYSMERHVLHGSSPRSLSNAQAICEKCSAAFKCLSFPFFVTGKRRRVVEDFDTTSGHWENS